MAGGATRLGVDFGTSTTVAVIALDGREPRPLLFDGSPLLPSAVSVDPTGRLVVGRDALHNAVARPGDFEPHPKRCVDDGTVLLGDVEFAVGALFSAVLQRVLDEARHLGDGPPDEVVVTHPAAWGGERRAILQAAAPSGARLVSEPVAAAHYFVDIAGNQVPDGRTAVHRGTATDRYWAQGSTLQSTVTSSDVQNTLTRNGKYNASGPTSWSLEPGQYSCSAERLLANSTQGNWSSESVRVPS